MWNTIIEFFQEQFKSNMLLQGGMALSVLGGIAVLLKKWGLSLWSTIYKRVAYSVTLEEASGTTLYRGVSYLYEKQIEKLCNTHFTKEYKLPTITKPYGSFLVWNGLFPIRVSFSMRKLEHANSIYSNTEHSLVISGLFARRRINQIIIDAEKEYATRNKPDSKSVMVYKPAKGESIKFIREVRAKSLEDIIMPKAMRRELMETLEMWKNSDERYMKLGLPYKLGLLLHGVPGTGKTSIAYAIARYMEFNVVRCSLFDTVAEDMFSSSKSVYVFDDIDREMVGLRMESMPERPEIKPDIKMFLSLLDAKMSAHNIIVVMSCNDITALDEAIFRPGRVDMVLKFDYPTRKLAEEFMTKFFGKQILLPNFKHGRGISFYQTCCLRHMNDSDKAIAEACDEMSNINYDPKGMEVNMKMEAA